MDDRLALHGGLVGAWIGYTLGERVPLHFRVDAGALVGSLLDERTNGRFTAQDGSHYDVGPFVQRQGVAFFYATPEVRVGLPLGGHLEIDAGIAVPVLVGLGRPTFDVRQPVHAGDDGIGAFTTADVLVGHVLFAVAPGIGACYDF